MTTLLTLAGLSLLAAAPALAADSKPSAAPPADRVASTPDEHIRYCVVTSPPTGTRIWSKECRSREEWLKSGFDPLAAKVIG